VTKARTNADNVTADIAGITAGTGITGGGTSGTVTVTNSMATAIDAAGDLIYGTGSDAFTRLGLGTASQILRVNSGATAPEWDTPAAGGGMTLLSTTALTTGSSVTISSISQSYKNLYVLVRALNTSGGAAMTMRLNGDTGANYQFMWIRNETGVLAGDSSLSQTSVEALGGSSSNSGYVTLSGMEFVIPRYSETEYKQFYIDSYQGISSFPSFYSRFINWNNTAAITSLTFTLGSGTFTAGNIFVYGVS
jgi:hypothetical protein